MERLTEIKTHVTGFSYADKKEGIFAQNVYAKLAEYEDTGLTPEQIENQKQIVDSYAQSASVIALYLKDFCNEKLSYDEMIADAARKASGRIEALTADKDEQAGTIMRLANGLKKLRSSLQWLKETIHDLGYKAWAEDNIGKIDALLGGKENA